MNDKITEVSEKKGVPRINPLPCVSYSLIAIAILKIFSDFFAESSYFPTVTIFEFLWDAWNSAFLVLAGIFTTMSFVGRVLADSSIVIVLPLIGMVLCLIKKQKEINKLFDEEKELYIDKYGWAKFTIEIDGEKTPFFDGEPSGKDILYIVLFVIFLLFSLCVTLFYPCALHDLLEWILSYSDGSAGGMSEWISHTIIGVNNTIISIIPTIDATIESYTRDDRDYFGIIFIHLFALIFGLIYFIAKKNKDLRKMERVDEPSNKRKT